MLDNLRTQIIQFTDQRKVAKGMLDNLRTQIIQFTDQ